MAPRLPEDTLVAVDFSRKKLKECNRAIVCGRHCEAGVVVPRRQAKEEREATSTTTVATTTTATMGGNHPRGKSGERPLPDARETPGFRPPLRRPGRLSEVPDTPGGVGFSRPAGGQASPVPAPIARINQQSGFTLRRSAPAGQAGESSSEITSRYFPYFGWDLSARSRASI